jgi:propanol-preferring alcohol dehydrogenase
VIAERHDAPGARRIADSIVKDQMRAMVLEHTGGPLVPRSLPVPEPAAGQVLLRVLACGVCRTDLHILDGELTEARLPVVPGHEIVGEVVSVGDRVDAISPGTRVGIPWLASTCGHCPFCTEGRENLCDAPQFTGYTVHGGYAEYTVADAGYCFTLPEAMDPVTAAPLLCAGLIGYRTYRLAELETKRPARVGIYGFGAAAHLITPLALHEGHQVYAFTRPDDVAAQRFARSLGATWAGSADEDPPCPLDTALIFAPAGPLVPRALSVLRKGGSVVCGGIHMSDIPGFAYRLLWEERQIRSVANLTRADGEQFLPLAHAIGIAPQVHRYALSDANDALDDLRHGRFSGAAVLVP